VSNAALVLASQSIQMEGLPERIRNRVTALQARGVTQQQIAERGAFSQGALQNWMKGARRVPRNLRALARALECSVNWLITGEDRQPVGYAETKIIAELLEGLSKLRLPWTEQALIFQKAYAVAVTRLSSEDSGRAENAPLLEGPDTSD